MSGAELIDRQEVDNAINNTVARHWASRNALTMPSICHGIVSWPRSSSSWAYILIYSLLVQLVPAAAVPTDKLNCSAGCAGCLVEAKAGL